jgi:hypothetical protein
MTHTSLYGRSSAQSPVTLILTEAQYATWDKGHWDAFHIEQDLLEQVDALGICEPVCVVKPDGVTVAFGITPARAQRRAL